MLDDDFDTIKKSIKEGVPTKLKTKVPLGEIDENGLWEILLNFPSWIFTEEQHGKHAMAEGMLKINYLDLKTSIEPIDKILSFLETNFLKNVGVTVFFSIHEDSKGLGWHRDFGSYVLGMNLFGDTTWESQGYPPIDLSQGEMLFMPEPVKHRVIVHSAERITCGFYGQLKA